SWKGRAEAARGGRRKGPWNNPAHSTNALQTPFCSERGPRAAGPILKRRSTLPRSVPRLALAPVAVAVLGSLAAWPLYAQTDGLVLQPSLRLQENLPPEAEKGASVTVMGRRIEGQTGGVTTVEGDAELRRHDMVIRADRLSYDENTGEATAEGQV